MTADRITIYCDNISEKHGKKHPNPLVWAYRYDENHRDGTGHGWMDDISHSERLRNNRSQHQILVGNEKFSSDKFTIENREEWADKVRESWVLSCGKCGYQVPITGSNLYSILDRMRDAGWDRIGLLVLNDTLRNRLKKGLL